MIVLMAFGVAFVLFLVLSPFINWLEHDMDYSQMDRREGKPSHFPGGRDDRR